MWPSRRSSSIWMGRWRLAAPLKNECVKAPGMTAPAGRGSKNRCGNGAATSGSGHSRVFTVVSPVFIHLDEPLAHGRSLWSRLGSAASATRAVTLLLRFSF
jgi:hypothetical protein